MTLVLSGHYIVIEVDDKQLNGTNEDILKLSVLLGTNGI